MTPFFAITKSPNLKVGASDNLQAHLLELIALEALSTAVCEDDISKSSWTTSASKHTEGGALSFAAFRGKIVPNEKTGRPEPEVTAGRNLSLNEFRDLGFFDGFGRADEDWQDDDIALGINFSRLHRVARMIENRAPDFMRTMQARIDEDMRASATYADFESAAERRRIRHEKERRQQHEAALAASAERERLAQEQREREHAEALEVKRKFAALLGHTFSDDTELDCSLEMNSNKTTKGYENTYKAPMPEPWAQNGPFTWVKVRGVQKRVFFDVNDNRVPEPN